MGLTNALVDRARVVRKEAATQRVGGRTSLVPTASEWFRARLFLPGAGEAPDALDSQAGRRRQVKVPKMLVAVRDFDREFVELEAQHKVEIEARKLPGAAWTEMGTWEVMGDPEMMRRRSGRVLGYYVQVKRVVEPDRDKI